MKSVERLMCGKFAAGELRHYVAVKTVVFWGLIFLVWLLYPEENHHSIMTHTLSFLGSYEAFHNPQWWWLFSLALCFWGAAMIPLVRYAEKRLALISPCGARFGALLMYIGATGIIGVGLFPEGQATIMGNITTSHGHRAACLLLEIGVGGGIFWHGALLLRGACTGGPSGFRYHRFIAPHVFLGLILVPIFWLLASRQFVFPPLTAEETVSVHTPGSEWYNALNSVRSFPFWENLLITAVFVFLCWFALLLPSEREGAQV